MAYFDHAQAPRLGQPTPVENPGVQLVTLETLPEIAYRGQIVYLLDEDEFRVYDGVAWQNPTSASMGGTQTFVGPSEPVADNEGDLWMNNATFQLYVWDGSDWIAVIDPDAAAAAEAASDAMAAALDAIEAAGDAQSTADGKITTFYTPAQPTTPTYNPQTGDLWINTATNRLYRFSSPTTVDEIQDEDIAQAINDAGTAQATADEKITSYYIDTAPTGLGAADIGDLWFDLANGNKVSRWDGAQWTDLLLGSGGLDGGAVSGHELNEEIFLSSTISTRERDVDGNHIGPGLDISPAGVFTFDADGNPRVELPNDPSMPDVFRGNAEIDHLTVSTLTTLQSVEQGENSTYQLNQGVSNPTNPPTVKYTYDTLAYADKANWYKRRGLFHDGTTIYTVLSHPSKGYTLESWDPATGLLTDSEYWVGPSSGTYVVPCGLVKNGSYIYVLARNQSLWKIFIHDVSGLGIHGTANLNATGTTSQLPVVDTASYPILGWDYTASQLLISQTRSTNGDKLRWQRLTVDPATSAVTWISTNDSTWSWDIELASCHYGSFDFGANRYVVVSPSLGGFIYASNGANVDAANAWAANCNYGVQGLAWNGTNFLVSTTGGTVQNYTTYNNAPNALGFLPVWCAYTWTDGTHETKTTTPIKLQVQKRSVVNITTPALPVGVTAAKVYLTDDTTPTSGGLTYNGTTTGPTLVLASAMDFTTNNSPTVNDFLPATPAKIISSQFDLSTAPYIDLRASGFWRLGPYASDNFADLDGTWKTWTPSWSGTGVSLGNGTISAKYLKQGKQVDIEFVFTAGSSTNFGSGLTWTFTLPVTSTGARVFLPGVLRDTSGTDSYPGGGEISSTTTMVVRSWPTVAGNIFGSASASVPFTWATGDTITISGRYLAA